MTAIKSAATVCLLVLSSLIASANMVVQACFSPRGQCATHLLREIELAKKELLVAVYAFTSDELAAALVHAKKRGVAVQVVIDREFDSKAERSKGKYLELHNVPVRRVSGFKLSGIQAETGTMHQKFAVIDRQSLFTGSYNWTHSAESLNDENLLFFRDAGPLADEFRKVFVQLWERR